ncbi:transposase [Lachnospiraceae bacterium YH-ros2228]
MSRILPPYYKFMTGLPRWCLRFSFVSYIDTAVFCHRLNTIRLGRSHARIEATNNKIKLIIRKTYGFCSIQNMLGMVYL